MKSIPVKLVPLPEMSPIQERLLGGEVLSPRKSYGGQYAGHTEASPPDEISSNPSAFLGLLAKGISLLADKVASEVKVCLGDTNGEATIEIPLPGGGIAWIGLCQGQGDSEFVVFLQGDPEGEPTDISRTINPTDLDLGLDDIYSRLCAFVGGDSSAPVRKSPPADNTGKCKTVTTVPSKGSSGGRKRTGKSTPAKKKVRRVRSCRGNGKHKHRSQKRKHKKGKW